jgi:hypothetical protein
MFCLLIYPQLLGIPLRTNKVRYIGPDAFWWLKADDWCGSKGREIASNKGRKKSVPHPKKDPILASLKLPKDFKRYLLRIGLPEESHSTQEVSETDFGGLSLDEIDALQDDDRNRRADDRRVALEKYQDLEFVPNRPEDKAIFEILSVLAAALAKKYSDIHAQDLVCDAMADFAQRPSKFNNLDLGSAEELKDRLASGEIDVGFEPGCKHTYRAIVIYDYREAIAAADERSDVEDAVIAAEAEAAVWRYDETDFGPPSEPWGS